MFDIGFSEMMLIAVVALVVIGPEKLPRVARTLGAWMGRMQRYVNDVKADINREVELDELRKFKQQFEQTASGVENEIRAEVAKVETAIDPLAGVSSASTAATPAPAVAEPAVTPAPAQGGQSGPDRPAPPAAA